MGEKETAITIFIVITIFCYLINLSSLVQLTRELFHLVKSMIRYIRVNNIFF